MLRSLDGCLPGRVVEPKRRHGLREPDPRRWRALALCLVAGFMTLLDVSIVNVALPSIQQDLEADAEPHPVDRRRLRPGVRDAAGAGRSAGRRP